MTFALFDRSAAAAPQFFGSFKNSFGLCSSANFNNVAEWEDITRMDFRKKPQRPPRDAYMSVFVIGDRKK